MGEQFLSGKKVLMVIAPENFRDEELFEPRAVFEKASARVRLASSSLEKARGMLGGVANPDLLLSDARAEDYDAVVVVGGSGSPEYLWGNETLHRLVRNADAQGKVISAICLAGVVLARAGLLTGRRATVYKTRESLREYEKAGVKYSKEEVVTDDRFITAVGPNVATEFGEAIARKLGGAH